MRGAWVSSSAHTHTLGLVASPTCEVLLFAGVETAGTHAPREDRQGLLTQSLLSQGRQPAHLPLEEGHGQAQERGLRRGEGEEGPCPDGGCGRREVGPGQAWSVVLRTGLGNVFGFLWLVLRGKRGQNWGSCQLLIKFWLWGQLSSMIVGLPGWVARDRGLTS